jgi:Flp pilus assembly protein TadG
MKKIFSQITDKVFKKFVSAKRDKHLERGQVLVIVALSVIALTAVVGLAVDTGILYLNHGKLRRAVDAAALAATSQFREGYDTADLQKAAVEFLKLNGINDPTATVETCKTNPGDPDLCTTPPRKLVRVHATAVVKLTFLSVIGIRQTTVSATAVSEAASMDVVFVIDASDSMTYDAPEGDPMRDPGQCNPLHDCHPFEEVKDAAKAFVNELYMPYDRVSIVTFDNSAKVDFSFADFDKVPDANKKTAVLSALEGLEVTKDVKVCPQDNYDPGPCRQYVRYADNDPVYGNNDGNWYNEPIVDSDGNGIGDTYIGFDCPDFRLTGNPQTCGTTSIGKGLNVAGVEFSNKDTFRQEALWVVILLTDGAANGPSITCPNRTWTAPYCRDLSLTRHCLQDDTACLAKGGVYLDNAFDADDYARDMADFVGEEQGALIYTIGLGDLVRTSVPRAKISDPTQKCSEVPYDPVADCYGAGELLMRYAADVGLSSWISPKTWQPALPSKFEKDKLMKRVSILPFNKHQGHHGMASRSQALLEFALALPILLMLLFGIIDLAALFQAWLTVENIARQTVRYAVTGQYESKFCVDLDASGEACDSDQEQDKARLDSIIEYANHQTVALFYTPGA